MITGAHSIIYSTDADADRAFLRDVLGLRGVDVGGGWLIFGLPPAEVAVHPGEQGDGHELYLLCEDAAAFVAEMQAKGVACSELRDLRWGLLTEVTLPGGGKLGVYEPRHARPEASPVARPSRRRPARGGKSPKRKPKSKKKR
ncbi:MAG TPA: extradiol dioxygenase [Polyangia bacterium]|nr:extradiol dioxygenase [Polyangia bacterium]